MNQRFPYKTKVKLNIADIIIEAKSRFGLEPLTEDEKTISHAERFS